MVVDQRLDRHVGHVQATSQPNSSWTVHNPATRRASSVPVNTGRPRCIKDGTTDALPASGVLLTVLGPAALPSCLPHREAALTRRASPTCCWRRGGAGTQPSAALATCKTT